MNLIAWIGSLAFTAAGIPQVLHTWKTQSTEGIPLSAILLIQLGSLCFLLTGLSLHSAPLVVSYSITLVIWTYILRVKCKA